MAFEMKAGNPLDRRHREEQLADIVAKHGLREELGDYTDPQSVYELDDDTRDRLIAHTRQDAAHLLSLAIFIHRRQRRQAYAWWIVFAFLAYIAWRVS